MKKMKIIIMLMMTGFLLAPGPRLSAQTEKTEAAPLFENHKSISDYDLLGLKKKVSLDLRAMEILDVLKFLATEGNLNIVASKEVTGPVSLLINEVTIGDAIEIILSANGLAYEVKNNIIRVMPLKDYKALFGADFYDQKQTAIYQLKYASAKNIATMLGSIKSEVGKIVYDDSTGTLILIDTPAKIKEMSEVIQQSELPTVTRVLPTETKVFELKYALVENVKDEVTKVLTPELGTIRIDKRTNTFVITDLPHQIKKIETVLSAFDRKTREVFIEAKIVEVTLSDTFKWGIDWDYLTWFSVGSSKQPKNRFSINPESNLPLGLTGNFNKLTINSIANSDLTTAIEILQTVAETKILSNPHLTVEDGREASIKVTEKQPYQVQSTITPGTGATTTSTNYEFVDVGVTLNVKPLINEDGFISMVIKPDVSSITTWYGGAAQAAGAVPVVKSANAQTTVTVKDGVTIIIAGLIQDNKTRTDNQLPYFGDIPLLGYLFKNKSDIITRTETVVFLTPRIVEGDKSFLYQKDLPKMSKGPKV